MVTDSTSRLAFVCDYCGNQQAREERCANCGGASLSRTDDKQDAARLYRNLLKQAVKSQNRLKIFSAFLALGFVSICFVFFDPITVGEKMLSVVSKSEEPMYSAAEIRQKLGDDISSDYEFQYVSLHSSSGADSTTLVQIERNTRPIVLVLSSFEAVKWDVSNPYGVDILAIVYGSHWKGSAVTGDAGLSAIALQHNGAIGRFRRASVNCECREGVLRCTGGFGWHIVKLLEEFGSGTIGGHTTASSAASLRVPAKVVSTKMLDASRQRHLLEKDACISRTNSENEIRQKLASTISDEYEFVYAGVNRGAKSGSATILNIANNTDPIVLVLSSYRALNWQISNPFAVDIKAIIYSSYRQRSTVEGDITASTMILHHDGVFTGYVRPQSCRCTAGYYACHGTSVYNIVEAVGRFGPARLTGLSTEYSTPLLKVPETIIDESYTQTLSQQIRQHAQAVKTCDSEID